MAAVALSVAGCGSVSDGATAVPSPSITARPVPATSLAPDPNAGWFVGPPSGTQMKSNEVLEDADRFDLFIDSDEAAVYERTAVRRVRLRSYYAGASGGIALKLIESADPLRVLRALDRRQDGGLGRPFAALPHGHLRGTAVRMESTRAHEVVAHFSTLTFVQRPFVVVVEGYATSAEVSRRRTLAAARAQRDLLLTRRAAG